MKRFVLTTIIALLATVNLTVFAEPDPFTGVTIERLGMAEPAESSGYALVFLRITMEPGASIPAHSHPGHVILVVGEGEFTTEFTRGVGTLTRYEDEAVPITQGATHILRPGDSVAYDGSAAHTMVNASDKPLVLLVSALIDPDQDGFQFHDHHASH